MTWTWNHRVVHRQMDGVDYYGIHEVYYDEGGRLKNMTVDPVDMGWFEAAADIAMEVNMMSRALSEPILEYEDFHEADEDA